MDQVIDTLVDGFSGLWFYCIDGEVSSFPHYHMDSGLPFISELVLSTNTYIPDKYSVSNVQSRSHALVKPCFVLFSYLGSTPCSYFVALLEVGFEVLYVLGV